MTAAAAKKWPASILVVEDETIIALDIRTTLETLGYQVPAIAISGEEAIVKAIEYRPDLVLMDIHLRGAMDGIQAIEQIRGHLDVPVIYLTAYADAPTVERARKTEPYGYLLKPFEQRELHIVIEMALYRHEMQTKLRESERWLAATLRSIADSVVATDGAWKIRFMNPAAEKLTGWSAEEAIGRELAHVLPVVMGGAPRPLSSDDDVPGGGIAEGTLTSRGGERIPIQESSTTIRDDDSRVIGTVIAIREVTARHQLEARAASRRLLAAGERELQRIVLDMHDGPVQDIFAAVSQLQLIARGGGDDGESSKRTQQGIQLLERALGEIRNFIGAFRPPGFERRPLSAIIEGLAVQHETLTNQSIALDVAADLGDCSLASKIALYRILQEALANGYRHSGAAEQRVSVERRGTDIVLCVADEGRGFDLDKVLAREIDVGVEGGHFGLRGIQDRVAMLGGDFSLETSEGHGTVLTISLPAE